MYSKHKRRLAGGTICASLLLSGGVLAESQAEQAEIPAVAQVSSGEQSASVVEEKPQASSEQNELVGLGQGAEAVAEPASSEQGSEPKVEPAGSEEETERIISDYGDDITEDYKEWRRQILDMEYLTPEERDKYLKLLKSTKNSNEMYLVLVNASIIDGKRKQLYDSRVEYKEKIRNLDTLSADRKAAYEAELNLGSDTDELYFIYDRAIDENEKSRSPYRSELVDKANAALKDWYELRAKVNIMAEYPDNPDYAVQTKLWEDSLRQGITLTFPIRDKQRRAKLSDERLAEIIHKVNADFMIHANIELLTRRATLYRLKYPQEAGVDGIFRSHFIQSPDSNYSSLKEEALKSYFDQLQAQYLKLQAASDRLDAPYFNALRKVIDQAKKTSTENKTDASVEVFKAAKEKAETLSSLRGKKILDQNELEKATNDLTAAIAALEDKKPEDKQSEVKPKDKVAETKMETNSTQLSGQAGSHSLIVTFDKANQEVNGLSLAEIQDPNLLARLSQSLDQPLNNIKVFDIHLTKDGKPVQVSEAGLAAISLHNVVGKEVLVYRLKENGELELIPSTVDGSQVSFKIGQFTRFVIVTKDKQKAGQIESKVSKFGENRKVLPHTGSQTSFYTLLGFVTAIATFLGLKRKEK